MEVNAYMPGRKWTVRAEDYRADILGVIGIDVVLIPPPLAPKRKQNNYSLEIKG